MDQKKMSFSLFLFLLIIIISPCFPQEMMMSSSTTEAPEKDEAGVGGLVRVKAVGRSARIGCLYNSGLEQFSQISLLKKPLPPNLIKTRATPFTSTKYSVLRTYTDLALLLGISAQLTLGIRSGQLGTGFPGGSGGIGGSASTELRTKWNSAVGAINYETLTTEEIAEIYFEEIKDYISPFVLNTTNDTHVVIGVGYGATVLAKFEDLNVELHAAGSLSANLNMGLALEQLMFGIGGGVSINTSVTVGTETYKFDLSGDVFLNGVNYPSSPDLLAAFFQQIPDLISRSNGGRGRAIFYYMVPIENVREFLKWEPPPPEPVNETLPPIVLPPRSIADALELYEEIDIVRFKLDNIFHLLMSNRESLANRDLRKLLRLRRDFLNQTEEYRENLANAIVDIHYGKQPDPVWFVSRIINKCRNDETGLERIENIIDNDFREQETKVNFVELMRNHDAVWAGRTLSVDVLMIQSLDLNVLDNITVCVMVYHRKYLHKPLEFLAAILEHHLEREDNYTRSIIIIQDCDFPSGDRCQVHDLGCETLYKPEPPIVWENRMIEQKKMKKRQPRPKSKRKLVAGAGGISGNRIGHRDKRGSNSDSVLHNIFF